MIELTLLGGLGSFLAAASCQAPPVVSYEVSLVAEPVAIAANFSLNDISTLARGSPGKAGHPPVGFYVGTFGYSIDIARATLAAQCPERIAVHISMSISGRHIEIGRELASRRCLYSAFLSHYAKHAADDVSIVEKYRRRVERTLQNRPVLLPGSAPPETPLDRAEMARLTSGVVESALQGLSDDRAAAAERVDTPDEIERLTVACADRA